MALGPPPTSDPFDKVTRPNSAWINWLLALFGVVKTLGVSEVTVPTNGFTYTVPDTVELATLEPAGALAAGTVTLPANPPDGRKVFIHSTKQITALTIAPSTGTTVSTSFAATLAANTGIAYYFSALKQKWYRFQ